MHFNNPSALWLLLVLAVIVGVFAWMTYRLVKFQKISTTLLAYSKLPSWGRRCVSYGGYILAIMAGVLALADPYILITSKYSQYEDVRIIFLVDVSRSMVYAEDVPPNRLEATKQQIKKFYTSLDAVYECSILPFAGDTNQYFCPLTSNPNSFTTALEELDWRSAPTLGTDLTKAVESLKDVYIKKDKVDKSGLNLIILLSDGGREEALATNRMKLLQMVRQLSSKNFRFYTVGVGSDKAAPLIVRDSKGNFVEYIMDGRNIATSLMDEEILKQIAEVGNGRYYTLNASTSLAYDLEQVMKENRKADKQKIKLEKFGLQHYLFSVTVCLLFFCLLLNKV